MKEKIETTNEPKVKIPRFNPYDQLVRGETIRNDFDEYGDMVGKDVISEVMRYHPCLMLDIECNGKNGARSAATISMRQSIIFNCPADFYKNEKIEADEVVWRCGEKVHRTKTRHELVIHGKAVERDAYYITVSTAGKSMDSVVETIERKAAALKCYRHIAGFDVYYFDGRHKQYSPAKDNSQNDIVNRVRMSTLKTNEQGAIVVKMGLADPVIIPDQENISEVRAMYFGQLIMM